MVTYTTPSAEPSTYKNGHKPSATTETENKVTPPDTQVAQRAPRRRFTAAYKLRILAEADTCTKQGEIGALLRREGLYSATLASFRKQREEGKLVERNPELKRRQRRETNAKRQKETRRLAYLEAENRKLKILLELQKKVADLLDIPLTVMQSE